MCFERNVSKNIEWIAMKFGTDIHVPPRINCNDFGDPLTFSSSSIIRSKY